MEQAIILDNMLDSRFHVVGNILDSRFHAVKAMAMT